MSFSHPHVESLLSEGLWGFPKDKLGVNERRWRKIEVGMPALIYGEFKGERGIWSLAEVSERFESHEPVKYWIQNPTGYPLQLRLTFKLPADGLSVEALSRVKPVRREELASIFGVSIFKAKADRWSLLIFGDVKERGITYGYPLFKRVYDEFTARNKVVEVERPDHEKVKEIIYQIGSIQGRNPEKEYLIEDKRIDVIWRRTPRSVPSHAFEVQFGGNMLEALTKLKHAYDLWNSIPVLITAPEQVDEARRWIEGSFHELKDVFRALSWDEFKEYYEIKRKAKEIEVKLKIA